MQAHSTRQIGGAACRAPRAGIPCRRHGCGLLRPLQAAVAEKATGPVASGSAPSHETDIIVIGSGIGGLSCAALLAKYGYKVSLLPTIPEFQSAFRLFERPCVLSSSSRLAHLVSWRTCLVASSAHVSGCSSSTSFKLLLLSSVPAGAAFVCAVRPAHVAADVWWWGWRPSMDRCYCHGRHCAQRSLHIN